MEFDEGALLLQHYKDYSRYPSCYVAEKPGYVGCQACATLGFGFGYCKGTKLTTALGAKLGPFWIFRAAFRAKHIHLLALNLYHVLRICQ
jgi:hypothetical protein